MKRSASLLVIASLLLSSCASPTVVEQISPRERDALNCEQIRSEIASAERFRVEARKEDRFKFGYILIAPALVSIWNMHKAESAAKDREEALKELAAQKQCPQ